MLFREVLPMRGLLMLAILLAFPVLEIFTLVRLADLAGWWLLGWLLLAVVLGVALVRDAGFGAPLRLLAALQSGKSLGASLFYGFIPLLAGVLLIFPGVFSDALAFVLLLWQVSTPPPELPAANGAEDDGVIEGEWRQVDDARRRLP
jgi:UPF0716 protein FxsA